MGTFSLDTDCVHKIVKVELEGSFSQEDGLNSILAYQQRVNPINSEDYRLEIDCRQLHVTAPETVPLLETCFVMFKRDKFSNVNLILENNPILKMQLARLGRKAGLDTLEITSATRITPIH
ncbi:hypothetical protein [Paenibacillus donghaensis]|uniref:STAS domain-containing protein n=1 Tax=Paenibacillus donghaensis TaxID=414771 RepID=A0A2Z2KI42_9BACL|nr:hypothetical protein [Paenibacillus donghaensis]ASA22953.1 hypothetical protein B9T62_20375 [Paenibacillus donghaensis]